MKKANLFAMMLTASALLPLAAHAQDKAAGAAPVPQAMMQAQQKPATAPVTESASEPAAEQPVQHSYTVAVLPFTASGSDAKDMADEVPILMNAFMSASPDQMMVERADVDKALSEVELGKSGTVDPETAAKVGHLVGAQVLVTGRIFPVQRDLIIVAKIIGVETGRTYGETVSLPARGNIKDAAQKLSDKVSAIISKQGETLISRAKDKEDVVAKLRPLVEGMKNLPSVSVTIDAMNMDRTDTDTSAQTEIAWVLEKLGFTVVDELATNKKADIDVTGSAMSEFAMRKGNLVSAKARVEIKAVNHADGKVVLIDREPTVAVDLSPQAAGKEAQAKAASALAERLVKAIVDQR
ncbi:MAG: curli assembly protein CsgG [Alphaproteobacteria bacterium]|nr:curli assembly protein CsgG [Alphaproteobacteria bacterium]